MTCKAVTDKQQSRVNCLNYETDIQTARIISIFKLLEWKYKKNAYFN